MMPEKFGFDAAQEALQSGQPIAGKDGFLAPLVKQLTGAVLDSHLVGEGSVPPNLDSSI